MTMPVVHSKSHQTGKKEKKKKKKKKTHLSCKRCPVFQMLNICVNKKMMESLCQVLGVKNIIQMKREVSSGNLCMLSHEESVNFL